LTTRRPPGDAEDPALKSGKTRVHFRTASIKLDVERESAAFDRRAKVLARSAVKAGS
jgi:hypothetical protein